MTISTTTNRQEYAGNGVTTAFSYPNKFLANGDLVVLVVVDATGVATTKTLTTHYTVTGAGASNGGTVTMLTAPAVGETLVIYNDPALTQSTDLIDGDALPANSVENMSDRLTLIAQRQKNRIDRAFRLADGDTSGIALELSNLDASQLIAVNSAGTALEGVAAADVSLTTVSTFAATLLDDTSAAVARATLGAMQQVMTTRGDIVRGGVGGVPERVALGASGAVLTSDGTDATWVVAAPVSNNGSFYNNQFFSY